MFTLCVGEKRRLWRDCAYAKIHMSFCCPPKSCWLAYIMSKHASVLLLTNILKKRILKNVFKLGLMFVTLLNSRLCKTREE